MGLEESVQKYLEWAEASFNYDAFRQKRRQLTEFCVLNKLLSEVTIEDIVIFCAKLDKSETVKWTYRKNIKAFLHWTNLKGWTKLQLDLIQNKKCTEHAPNIMTQSEYDKIIQNCNEQYRTLFTLLWESGLRIGEILTLKANDFDLENRRFYIKSEKSNQLDVGYYVSDLSKYILKKRNKYLFDVKQNAIRRALFRACDRAGVKRYNPHSFRHGRATELLKNGCPVKMVQEILRHKSIDSTMTYVHLLQEDVENSYRQHMTQPKILKLSALAGRKKKYHLELRITKEK